MSYAKKTIIGTLWNTLSSMGNQVIAFLVYVLLARLLSVEEFGLIAFSFLILLSPRWVIIFTKRVQAQYYYFWL